ncbi:MAG: HU family DNA-binding protein [Rhodospirillaceae bacterium]|nr:HU family DNA-binding protein [Rhodospirillaceae bacterium]
MNKSDIVSEVAARTGLNRTDAAGAVDAVFEAVSEALGRREDVRIAGFGQFATRSRPARTGRNPRTGEPVAVEASTAPTFKPARALREAVNAGVTS